MDQVKRKLSYKQPSEEKTKKLQNELGRSITSIEIFDYLGGCEIYQSFSNLNHHFQELLNSSSLLFKIKLHRSTSQQIFMNSYKQIFLLNTDQIFSIHLSRSIHNNEIISLFNINLPFNRLESLIFGSIETGIPTSLLPKLTRLPRFFSLTIDTWYILKDLDDVYRLIFDLPKLRYIRFSAMEPEQTDVTVSLPIATNKQFSTIEKFFIDHPCTLNDLFSRILYTPQICRLNFMHTKGSNLSIRLISLITLLNLTHLSIYGHYITFDKFEMFITKIDLNLKFLFLASLSEDVTYLDDNRWEETILKYLPQLEKFYFKYYAHFPNDFVESDGLNIIHKIK